MRQYPAIATHIHQHDVASLVAYPCMSPSIHPSTYASTYASTYKPMYPSSYLAMYPCIYLSIHLSLCLSMAIIYIHIYAYIHMCVYIKVSMCLHKHTYVFFASDIYHRYVYVYVEESSLTRGSASISMFTCREPNPQHPKYLQDEALGFQPRLFKFFAPQMPRETSSLSYLGLVDVQGKSWTLTPLRSKPWWALIMVP